MNHVLVMSYNGQTLPTNLFAYMTRRHRKIICIM